jgi:N-methylhydantoinase B
MTTNETRSTLLRDLTEAQFHEKYSCDRFTATVLSSRLRYIVQHMCSGLLKNAFSLILRDWYDFAATVSGPPELNYPMSSLSNSLAMFLGTMAEGVRNTIEEYGPENVRDGDVIIANDPYRTGNHVNDLCFIRPVFYEGKIVSFVTLRAHQLDMGGTVPAGFSATKHNVYEDGVVINPTLLYSDNKPVRSTFHLIFDNARFGELLLPDIKTIFQNLLLGEELIIESIKRYGVDAFLGVVRYCTDVSAEAMANSLDALPDGVYNGESGIDCDAVDETVEYKLKVKLTKIGSNLEIDFSGTSPQARSSINCGVFDTKTSVGVAMKFLLDPHTPFTSGSYRNIDLVIPPGTFISATPPDGAVFLYWESSGNVLLAIFRALEDALGPRAVAGDYGSLNIHNASGVMPDGTPWVSTAQCGGEHGPWGATSAGDGDSYSVVYLANNLDPATEAIESDVPAVVLRKEYLPDSAGAGSNRGGAGVLKDTMYLTDADHWSNPLQTKRSSGIGVYGGQDGKLGATWLFDGENNGVAEDQRLLGHDDATYRRSTPIAGLLDPETKELDPGTGEYFYFASKQSWRTTPNTVFRYLTNGGGGWGNPYDRDPQRVARDVRDEYITIEGAYRDYGVVITGDPQTDPEGVDFDAAATEARRQEMREAAGA